MVMSDAEYRRLSEAQHERLKSEVKAGFDQLDRGEFSPHSADEIAERVLASKLDSST